MRDTLVLQNIVNAFPYSAGYKNKDSVFIHANMSYAKVVGLNYAHEVVGKTAWDMPAKTSECALLFQEQDRRVMTSGKHLVIFGIHPNEQTDFKAYKFIKIPLRNKQNKITGIFFTGEEISNKTTYELSLYIKNMPVKTNGKLLTENGSYLVGAEHTEVKMSEKQHEVLFYLLHGKQIKFIADMFDITLTAVNKHIAELKKEFNILSSFELIDKAIDMGFFYVFPTSVFNKKLSRALHQN